MPPFLRPTKLPEWASGDTADVVEPTAGEKSLGWAAGQTPPAPYMNWLMGGDFGYFPWLQYVSTFEQQALTWPERQTFQKGFAASGQRSTIAGLDVTSGQTVVGGLATDTLTASGAVSGSTVTGTTVTATNFTYDAPVTSYAYLTMEEVAISPTSVSDATGQVNAARALLVSRQGAGNTISLSGRIRVPAGSVLVGLEILAKNTDTVQRSIAGITLAMWTAAGAADMTQTQVQSASPSVQNVPAGSANFTWRSQSINANIAMAENGFLHFYAVMDGTTDAGQLQMAGIRVQYSQTTLR